MSKKLTGKQQRFADEYLLDLNATAAYKRAGYAGSGNGAEVNASILLRHHKVAEYIAEQKKKRQEKYELIGDQILRELARIAFSDVRKAFGPDGGLLPINEWPDEVAAMVASVEVDELFDGNGKDRKQIGFTKKLKMWDKNSAIEKAMKHLGLFKEDNKQKTDPVSELLSLIHSSGTKLPIKE